MKFGTETTPGRVFGANPVCHYLVIFLVGLALYGPFAQAAVLTTHQAKSHASLVMRYGRRMPRADARLLDLQVQAIKQAVLAEDLTVDEATTDLLAQGIDKRHVMRLMRRWEHQLAKRGMMRHATWSL